MSLLREFIMLIHCLAKKSHVYLTKQMGESYLLDNYLNGDYLSAEKTFF